MVAHFRAAQRATQDGKMDVAVNEYKTVLRLDPSVVEARINLGLAYHMLGEYEQSAVELAKALHERPGGPGVLGANIVLGIDYLKLGQPQKAVAPLREALAIEPSNREAHRGLAASYLAEGDYGKARSEFQRVFSLEPDKEQAWFALGRDYLDVTRQLTVRMATRYQKTAWRHRLAGDFLGQRRLWNDAVREYRKALALQPAQPGLHTSLGDAMLQTVDHAEAESEFRAELKLRSKRSPVQSACESDDYAGCINVLESRKSLTPWDNLALGKADFASSRYESAADAFAAALAESSENPEAIYWLVRAYTALADGCFAQLMTKYPDSWRAHQLRAETYQVRQADKDAIEEYKAAARLHPDDFELHRALGELYLPDNSLEDAERELERALTLNPADGRSLYLFGRYCVARRDTQKAIPYLERALRYEPGLLEARAALGKAYLRTGNPALAVPQLQKAMALDRYGDLHYLLYEAYRDLGKKDLAQTALAQSQELRQKSAADDQAKIKYSTGIE